MNNFRLLIVEDNENDLKLCRDAVIRYSDEKKRNIFIEECRTLEESLQKLDNSFDGAIIDLKLADEGDEGKKVIDEISNSYFRIPIAVFSGTPYNAGESLNYIGQFTKGEITYIELFDKLWEIYDTGLTRIMGGRGIIERTLNSVFVKNILPQKDIWISYGETDSEKTEKALLRHTLNHLLQLLDNDEEKFYPEEVYIYPPLDDRLRTGVIVKKKDDDSHYVVLNPACDLVLRQNNDYKTDRILLCEIDNDEIIGEKKKIPDSQIARERKRIEKCKYHNSESESYKCVINYQNEKIQRNLLGLFFNSQDLNYHWLPNTFFFKGGFLNFRKITTFSKQDFNEKFNSPEYQISPYFIKDIISRFSSYYARQGQPNIECDEIIKSYLNSHKE